MGVAVDEKVVRKVLEGMGEDVVPVSEKVVAFGVKVVRGYLEVVGIRIEERPEVAWVRHVLLAYRENLEYCRGYMANAVKGHWMPEADLRRVWGEVFGEEWEGGS